MTGLPFDHAVDEMSLRAHAGSCGIGQVSRLTLPGKKPVDAKAFWNGLNGREASWVGGGE